MNTDRIDQQLSTMQYARLLDAAKASALAARREAINQFWAALAKRCFGPGVKRQQTGSGAGQGQGQAITGP